MKRILLFCTVLPASLLTSAPTQQGFVSSFIVPRSYKPLTRGIPHWGTGDRHGLHALRAG